MKRSRNILFVSGMIGLTSPVALADSNNIVASFDSLVLDKSSLLAKDLDGDCKISPNDLAIALAMRIDLNSEVPTDIDGDDFYSGADVLLLIQKSMLTSINDVDGNGSVNGRDLVRLTSELYSTNGQADVNGDQKVDARDLRPILENFGHTVVSDVELLSYAVFDRFMYYQEQKAADQLRVVSCKDPVPTPWENYANRSAASTPGGSGTFGNSAGTSSEPSDTWPDNDHSIGVSRTYPPNTHNWFTSWWTTTHMSYSSGNWPGNHLYTLTINWQPTPVGSHGTLNSENEAWPPNHTFLVSKDWTPQVPVGHGLTNSGVPIHQTEVSERWPPNHDPTASNSWPPPEHAAGPSGQTVHDNAVSGLWPPSHNYEESRLGIGPTTNDHTTLVSNSYAPHLKSVSRKYPPNHGQLVSSTWNPGAHNGNVSDNWPANHSSQASNYWPDIYPGIWPPNHNVEQSNSWGEPQPPGPGLFPPDHAWVPSFNQVMDIVPDLPVIPDSP